MFKEVIFFTLAIGYSNFSGADSSCALIEKASLAISVHAYNWSNSNTTRTPEGGAYRVRAIKCGKAGCHIQEQRQFKVVYDPSHIDADTSGNVNYPDIDKAKEYTAVSAQAQVLRQLGRDCPQKVKVVDQVSSVLIHYRAGPVQLDIFNFKNDHQLVSWVRETKNGPSQIINF